MNKFSYFIATFFFCTALNGLSQNRDTSLQATQFTFEYNVSKLNLDSQQSFVTPAEITLSLTTITNGKYYLISPSVDRFAVYGYPLPDFSDENNTDVLIDSEKKFIYFFSTKTYSPYDTMHVRQIKFVPPDEYTVVLPKGDSATFKTGDSLNIFIKPFPSFPTFSHGILSISKPNSLWKLKEIKKTHFDFLKLQAELQKFRFQQPPYKFPYM